MFAPRRLSDPAFDALVEAYYIDNPAGGHLHVILDEGSVVESHLLQCLGYAAAAGDDLGMVIAQEMLRMDIDDRRRYNEFVEARAARRGRGIPDDPHPTFSLVPPEPR